MTEPRRAFVKPTRDHNGSNSLVGRIEVGPLVRIAPSKAEGGPGVGLAIHGFHLLATRDVFLDGEHIGVAERYERSGRRMRDGHDVGGRGLPIEWRLVADGGRDYGEYAHRLLSTMLFESVTVLLGGSL